tara:strand:- start:255 stop:560 length:306 start_codon:yes stop_codon:yes gene_type:complete
MSVSTAVIELRVATKAIDASDRVSAQRINGEAGLLLHDYRSDKNEMRNEYVALYEDYEYGLCTLHEESRLRELKHEIKCAKRNMEALADILKETKEIVCKF